MEALKYNSGILSKNTKFSDVMRIRHITIDVFEQQVNLLCRRVRTIPPLVDIDDKKQIARMAIFNLLRFWSPDKGASLNTYCFRYGKVHYYREVRKLAGKPKQIRDERSRVDLLKLKSGDSILIDDFIGDNGHFSSKLQDTYALLEALRSCTYPEQVFILYNFLCDSGDKEGGREYFLDLFGRDGSSRQLNSKIRTKIMRGIRRKVAGLPNTETTRKPLCHNGLTHHDR